VELELEVSGYPRTISCSPLQATIIHHFTERDKWTLPALAEAVGMEPPELRRRAHFWVASGVLRELVAPGLVSFVLVDDQPAHVGESGVAARLPSGSVLGSESAMSLTGEDSLMEESRGGALRDDAESGSMGVGRTGYSDSEREEEDGHDAHKVEVLEHAPLVEQKDEEGEEEVEEEEEPYEQEDDLVPILLDFLLSETQTVDSVYAMLLSLELDISRGQLLSILRRMMDSGMIDDSAIQM
jgi:hypothetical protein